MAASPMACHGVHFLLHLLTSWRCGDEARVRRCFRAARGELKERSLVSEVISSESSMQMLFPLVLRV